MNKQTARVAGEFYINAINVMRGAEAVSTYQPISDHEKFRIEYWALEEAKLQRMPKPKSLATPGGSRSSPAPPSGIGKAIAARLQPKVRASSSPTSTRRARRRPPRPNSATPTSRSASGVDVVDAAAVQARDRRSMLAFGGVDLVVNNAGLSLSKPLLETTEADWDLQHDVMAKGSFLVSKAAARAR